MKINDFLAERAAGVDRHSGAQRWQAAVQKTVRDHHRNSGGLRFSEWSLISGLWSFCVFVHFTFDCGVWLIAYAVILITVSFESINIRPHYRTARSTVRSGCELWTDRRLPYPATTIIRENDQQPFLYDRICAINCAFLNVVLHFYNFKMYNIALECFLASDNFALKHWLCCETRSVLRKQSSWSHITHRPEK